MNKHVYTEKTQNEIEHGDSMLIIAGAVTMGVALIGNMAIYLLNHFGM